MVEVEGDILEKLRCVTCSEYLSCGPVTLSANGGSVCGRCYESDKQLVRNLSYEYLASLAVFPCRYCVYGCEEKISFKLQKRHEENCKHRQYACPVTKSMYCTWSGSRQELGDHCKIAHSGAILQQPYVLEHDFKKDNQQSFILILYNVLFLLQTNVSLLTGKIYHSVRCFASDETAAGFSYQLVVKNKQGKIIQDGVVLSNSEEELNEKNSVVTNINGIYDFMRSYEGITFTIQLVRNRFSTICCDSETDSEPETNESPVFAELGQNNSVVKVEDSYYLEPIYVAKKHTYTYIQICGKCKRNIPSLVYQTDKEQLCDRCAPRRVACKNRSRSCDFVDIITKMKKHRRYFCNYTTWCWLCQGDFDMPIQEHYKSHHRQLSNGQEWLATSSARWENCVISHENDIYILEYFLSNNDLEFNVRSNINSKDIYKFSCELLVSNPITKCKLEKTLKCHYELWRDWTTQFDKTELKFLIENGKCEMVLFIIKKN